MSYVSAIIIVAIISTLIVNHVRNLRKPIPPEYMPVYEWITKYRVKGVKKKILKRMLKERGWDLKKINYMIR